MAAALGWGVLAASSLVLGALLALRPKPWPKRLIGAVLAFGAGALISAVSLELFEEGVALGGMDSVAAGLAAGALTFYLLNGAIERRFGGGDEAGASLALGAFLDGIPEQLVLGIGLASGEGVSVGLMVAIFVSNLPEAIGGAGELRDGGMDRSRIVGLWTVVAVACALATPLGFGMADAASNELKGAINGFAAGGLLVLLVDEMIPDAARKVGRPAGLVTTVGFAVAAALSTVS